MPSARVMIATIVKLRFFYFTSCRISDITQPPRLRAGATLWPHGATSARASQARDQTHPRRFAVDTRVLGEKFDAEEFCASGCGERVSRNRTVENATFQGDSLSGCQHRTLGRCASRMSDGLAGSFDFARCDGLVGWVSRTVLSVGSGYVRHTGRTCLCHSRLRAKKVWGRRSGCQSKRHTALRVRCRQAESLSY